MNKQLIEKLLSALLEDDSQPTTTGKHLIGEYVIVRCRDAGVHAGTLVDYEGREVILTNARRLWYWVAANSTHTLSGVAVEGITNKSKIPPTVEKIVLPEACEIIPTSTKAQESIENAAIYRA